MQLLFTPRMMQKSQETGMQFLSVNHQWMHLLEKINTPAQQVWEIVYSRHSYIHNIAVFLVKNVVQKSPGGIIKVFVKSCPFLSFHVSIIEYLHGGSGDMRPLCLCK